MSSKAILSNKLYLPEDTVNVEELKKKWEKIAFEEKICARCDSRVDRPTQLCLVPCQGFLGRFRFWSRKTFDDSDFDYIGIPRTAVSSYNKPFDDRRARIPLKHDLRIVSTLWSHQAEAVQQVLINSKFDANKGTYVSTNKNFSTNGILVAPARTGKTVIVLSLVVSFGQRALILAHQKDLLMQFMEDINKHTNFPEGSYGICSKLTDFQDPEKDICLATYQQLISDAGREKLEQIKDLFGSVFVDESHRSAANCYSKTISAFSALNIVGCTATACRKDQLEFVTRLLVGPVIASVAAESMVPDVHVHITGCAPAYEYQTFLAYLRFLERDEDRTDLILKFVDWDLQNGRFILIPVVHLSHVETLIHRINTEHGIGTAVGFTGKSDRKKVIEDARAKKHRVTIGIRSLISTGVNVPSWDTLYEICPISNTPLLTQELSRVLTKMENKPTPLIRFFVDVKKGENTGISLACFKNSWFNTVMKLGFNVTDRAKKVVKQLCSKRIVKAGAF